MNIIEPPAEGVQTSAPTCAACLTLTDSIEHHALCVAPLDQLEGGA